MYGIVEYGNNFCGDNDMGIEMIGKDDKTMHLFCIGCMSLVCGVLLRLMAGTGIGIPGELTATLLLFAWIMWMASILHAWMEMFLAWWSRPTTDSLYYLCGLGFVFTSMASYFMTTIMRGVFNACV